MKPKNTILLLLLLFISFQSFAQKPDFILPGQTKSYSPTNDTLWVLNNKQFKQTIIAKEQLKICNKEVVTYKQMVDTLKELNKVEEQKSTILLQDRDYYKTNWKAAEDDVQLLVDINKKQTAYTKIAIFTGIATTIAAFIGGFLLAK